MSTFDVDQAIRDLETTGKPPAWVTEHLRLYRESGGTEGHLIDSNEAGGLGPVTSLLLTTIGRRSGEKRTSPVFYGMAGDAYVIIASKGGAHTQPGWYLNLRANPVVKVQVRTEQFTARARVATGKEREQLWEQMVQMHPPYGVNQTKTKREFPVVVLEKQPSSK
jgi:deazaflavin-dependent oxidoreductase (nitroreductase family)